MSFKTKKQIDFRQSRHMTMSKPSNMFYFDCTSLTAAWGTTLISSSSPTNLLLFSVTLVTISQGGSISLLSRAAMSKLLKNSCDRIS